MLHILVARDIRAARCIVHDRAAFLRDLQAIAADYDTHIICFNADVIAGRVHAAAAVARAVRAFQEGAAISNTLEMESLLYASGSRQCSIAAAFGIHKGENRLFVCCFPARKPIWAVLEPILQFTDENWDVINLKKRTILMKTFTISPEEIGAAGGDDRIVDLVLERVALLHVMR
jgi:KEOPS complex subunit Cgi121